MAMKPAAAFLSGVLVDSWENKKGAVLELDWNTTVHKALKFLLDNGITSAPVWCEEESRYLGFVDVLDMVSLLAKQHSHGGMKLSSLPMFSETESVEDAVNQSSSDPFDSVPMGTTMLDVAKLHAAGVRRVPVMNSSGRVEKIISQSDVARLLAKHPESLGDQADKTIKEMHAYNESFVSCSIEDHAIDAFEAMKANNVSSIALVDDSGDIVTTLSASDIRVMAKDGNYSLLEGTALRFVSYIRQAPELHGTAKEFPATIVTTSGHSMLSALQKLAVTGIHSLYLVEPHSKKTSGTVGLTNIIKALIVS
eukprot:jgi/Mesvir1/27207/Mv07051-RA.1